MPTDWKNKLFFGDNLRILREHVADESVDLIYLDPPFNSNANYNVLFQEKGGEQSAAQIVAFEDTWHWTQEAENTFHETIGNAPDRVVRIMEALRGVRQLSQATDSHHRRSARRQKIALPA